MRYVLYVFTMVLLFVAGMLVGNSFLPQREASLASAVSVPELAQENELLQTLSREQAEQDLAKLNEFALACPADEQPQRQELLNRISLRLAIENFEFKKTKLELEIAKNNKNNRPTSQLTQAMTEYNQAREQVEKLAAKLYAPDEPDEETAPAEKK